MVEGFSVEAPLDARLAERYLSYIRDRVELLEKVDFGDRPRRAWWVEPGAIKAAAGGPGAELRGLHIALDPGHIGGVFAREEGREFQIAPSDFPVREGDLVLKVAQRVEAQLIACGARVTLLRTGPLPVNQGEALPSLNELLARIPKPENRSLTAMAAYAMRIRRAYFQEVFVRGDLLARAHRINEVIRPDVVLSLHINAAPWPEPEASEGRLVLVKRDHCHVLIFGSVSEGELRSPAQQVQVGKKMFNGSGPIEQELGAALGEALGTALGLKPSQYDGQNAYPMPEGAGYLWARNLLLLRLVECPVVLLEPFLANSVEGYGRLQSALRAREAGEPAAEDDILEVYAVAVVRAILQVYGPTLP